MNNEPLLRFSVKQYHERLFISKGTVHHFFKVETNRKGYVVPVIKRKDFEERTKKVLQEKIEEVKERYGGKGKIVSVQAVPYKHVYQYNEEEPVPNWQATTYISRVLPEIEKAWNDFDLYITVKELEELR